MLGVPLVSPPPPRPFPSPGAESRLPVSSPCAAGSSSTDIRAAGGRREPSEPEPNPRERAGGRVRRKEAADRGGSSAPATSGLPASPTVGQPQVQPRAATIPPSPTPPRSPEEGRPDPSANGYPRPRMGGGAGRSGLWVDRAGPFSPTSALGSAGALGWPMKN